MGAAFLGVGALAYGISLRILMGVIGSIDMVKAALSIGMLMLTMFSVVAMAVAAIPLTVLAPLGIQGAIAGAVFLTVGALAYGLALRAADAMLGSIDMANAAKNIGLMALTLAAMIPMAMASAALIQPAIIGLVGLFYLGDYLIL